MGFRGDEDDVVEFGESGDEDEEGVEWGRLNKTVGRHDWFESAVGRKDGWKDFVERWRLEVDWFWDSYDQSF
jgi:hypothetical protein